MLWVYGHYKKADMTTEVDPRALRVKNTWILIHLVYGIFHKEKFRESTKLALH